MTSWNPGHLRPRIRGPAAPGAARGAAGALGPCGKVGESSGTLVSKCQNVSKMFTIYQCFFFQQVHHLSMICSTFNMCVFQLSTGILSRVLMAISTYFKPMCHDLIKLDHRRPQIVGLGSLSTECRFAGVPAGFVRLDKSNPSTHPTKNTASDIC